MSRLALLPLASSLLLAGLGLAQAQPAPKGDPKDPKGKPGPSASAAPSSSATTPTGPAPADAPLPLPEIPLGSGPPLTADMAAKRAVDTSKQAKVDEAKIKASAAAVDQAFIGYFPRLSLAAGYTRLSPVDAGSLGGSGGFSVAATNAPGTPPLEASKPLPPTAILVAAPPFSFPVLLNQYTLSATLVVPISDYVFRVYDNHKSALSSQEAAKWTAKVNEHALAADARVAFYNVLRARGTVVIAKAAVTQADGHLKDLKVRLELKAATTADVAQVEASRAGAELAVIKSENLVTITETNLRMLMHAPDDEAFSLGEDLMAEIPKLDVDLKTLKAQAAANRPEFKALDAQIASVESTYKVIGAAAYPRLDAVAQLLSANPNQRIFPSQEKFTTTWSLGLQLTWSPNDYFVAAEQKKTVSATSEQLKATREQLSDALILDVTNSFVKVREAEASIISTGAELRAAGEALRVRKEQFQLGGIISTILTDAEADVTRARLNHLNARVELRIARAQLKKATGQI